MKRFGFTLSEVLVTLGIIGVVSAMTIPTLVKNHQRQVFVTQLKKVYSELSQAFQRAMDDNNAVNLKEAATFNAGPETFLKTYFMTSQICSDADKSSCLADKYKDFDGRDLLQRRDLWDNDRTTCAVLNSGAVICFKEKTSFLYIDINGKEGPNIGGRDVFVIYYDNDGSMHGCGDYDEIDAATSFDKIVNSGWKMDY